MRVNKNIIADSTGGCFASVVAYSCLCLAISLNKTSTIKEKKREERKIGGDADDDDGSTSGH